MTLLEMHYFSLYDATSFIFWISEFLADHTNGRAIGTVLRPSSSVCL